MWNSECFCLEPDPEELQVFVAEIYECPELLLLVCGLLSPKTQTEDQWLEAEWDHWVDVLENVLVGNSKVHIAYLSREQGHGRGCQLTTQQLYSSTVGKQDYPSQGAGFCSQGVEIPDQRPWGQQLTCRKDLPHLSLPLPPIFLVS